MNILIIEDEQSFAAILIRRLTKFNHHCLHVHNGNDALLQCRQFLPDVILLDMNLNNDSGLKYISLLKNILPNSRIILLTGFASIATAVEAIKLGAEDYLAKPIDTQTLLAAIEGKNFSDNTRNKIINDEMTSLSSEQLEWEHIQQALRFNQGNISATARQLSMHRRTLQRKLQKRPSFINKQ